MDNKLKERERIINHLSLTRNLSIEQVKLAVECQFKFINRVMKEGKAQSVRLQYWGIYGVKKRRQEHFDKINARREERNKHKSNQAGISESPDQRSFNRNNTETEGGMLSSVSTPLSS